MTARSESSVDKGWQTSINQIITNLKNTTTMRNENKCFFSISLENGITITGQDPRQVAKFILDMEEACLYVSDDDIETIQKQDYDKYWRILLHAYETIKRHIKY